MPDFEIPRVTVSEGTFPAGSQWARNAIPACAMCTAATHAACALEEEWIGQQRCSQACSGVNLTSCPPAMLQFAPPGGAEAPGLSGFAPQNEGRAWDTKPPVIGFPFSIVDRVAVPGDLEPGDYLLSWRWDCEQSSQVWYGSIRCDSLWMIVLLVTLQFSVCWCLPEFRMCCRQNCADVRITV